MFANAIALASLDRITRIMTELALDHEQRHAFARHLHRVGVSQLMRREPAPHPSPAGCDVQLGAGAGWCPRATSRRASQHAEQRPDRKRRAQLQPRVKLLPAPSVHADFPAFAALAVLCRGVRNAELIGYSLCFCCSALF